MKRRKNNAKPSSAQQGVSISRRQLFRNTALQGTGVALGLPLLDAMAPSVASAATAAGDSSTRPVRMAAVFFPNGVIVPKWEPKGVGKGDAWQLSETLGPLESMKSKLNVISGLAHANGRSGGDGAGDHARCCATYLTAARPLKTSSNIRLGESVDQVAARSIGQQTRLPSVELGLTGSRNAGSCDSGYSCAYSSNISWRNETQPMPKETSPRMAFDRLFTSGDSAARREQAKLRRSIMDVVLDDARRLQKRVGRTDGRKLDEYFTSVREIERRIDRAEQEDQAAMPDLKIPEGRVEAFREHARLMYDIMAVGFQTDTTRVATLMLDTAGGNRSYHEVDVKSSHHGLSHHRDDPDKVAQLSRIDHYLVEQFSYFLEKLDSIPDGNGTLLDQSMILYGSGISDGNRHRHEDLPVVLAGGAGGAIETNRHIQLKEETPMANLFVSMLQTMGVNEDAFGDSTGNLNELV